MHRLKNNCLLTAIVLVTIAISFGLYSYFTPLVNEDIAFQNIYKSYNHGEMSFSLTALFDSAREIRLNDNGRLANFIAPVMSGLFPHLLFSVLTGCIVAFIFLLINVIARIPRTARGFACLAVCVASLILLPWRDWIIINDYALNYLYSSALILSFIYVLELSVRTRLNNFFYLPGAILLAIIAGWFHEGFSVPICGALFFYTIYKKFKLPWTWWIPTLCFGLAALFSALSPGIIERASTEYGGYSMSEQLRVIVTALPAVVLMVILTLFSLRLKWMETIACFKNQSFFVLFVAALLSAVMCLSVHSAARASWPAELYAMTCDIWLCRILFSKLQPRRFSRLSRPLFIILYLGFIAFFVNLLVWQYKFLELHNEICDKIEDSRSGTVYHDFDFRDVAAADLQTLRMATNRQWVSPIMYRVLNDRDFNSSKQIAVVPAALSDYDPDSVRNIAGNARVALYNDVLIADPDIMNPDVNADNSLYDFTFTDSHTMTGVECLRIKFMDNKGKLRVYIRPKSTVPVTAIRSIDTHQ